MGFDLAFNPPQFFEEYDGVKMRQLVEELERLHAVLTSDTTDEGVTAAVDSFNTRTGDVLPLQGDYDSFFLTPAEGNAAYSALGHSHSHTALSDIGTNTHGQIDTHIALFDFAGAADNDMLFRSGGKWIDTAGELQWNPTLDYLQLANSHSINWADTLGTTREMLVFDSFGSAGAALDYYVAETNTNSITTSQTYVDTSEGLNQTQSGMVNGDSYLIMVRAGMYNNNSSSAPTNGFKITGSGGDMAGSEHLYEGLGLSGGDNGNPYGFVGYFTANTAGAALRTQHKRGTQGTDHRVTNETSFILNLTTDVPNHVKSRTFTELALSSASWLSTDASVTLGAGDWLIFCGIRVGQFNGAAHTGVGINDGSNNIMLAGSTTDDTATDWLSFGGMYYLDNYAGGTVTVIGRSAGAGVFGIADYQSIIAIPLSDFAEAYGVQNTSSAEQNLAFQSTDEIIASLTVASIAGTGTNFVALGFATSEWNGTLANTGFEIVEDVNTGGETIIGWNNLWRNRKATNSFAYEGNNMVSSARSYTAGDDVDIKIRAINTNAGFSTQGHRYQGAVLLSLQTPDTSEDIFVVGDPAFVTRIDGSRIDVNADMHLNTGAGQTIWDAADEDSATSSHDGIDFNSLFTGTTDWNITGLTGRLKTATETYAYLSEISGAEINDLTAAVTWANVPDANITQGSVTQHQAALTILESQITDGSILARVGSAESIGADWNWQDNLIQRPEILDYGITEQVLSIVTNAATFDLVSGNVASIDLEAATGNVTLTLSNPPASGTYGEALLVITQGTTPYDIIWPGSVTWQGGSAPGLAQLNNVVDIVHLQTVNGGANWYGTFATAAGSGEINDLTAAVTWANVPNANITVGSVTQHESSLTILESQITDGSILARVSSAESIGADWNWQDNVIQRPEITDYGITEQVLTITANAATFNLTLGNVASIDLEAATAAVVLTLSNPPGSGTYGEALLVITQGSVARDITWPGSVSWQGGSAPSLTQTNNSVDIVHLQTVNGGTNWYGTYATAAGGSSSLSGLSDTLITSPADAAMLLYDTGTSKWRDATMSGDASIGDTGALTIATVDGIDVANLLDKSTTELIAGAYDFRNTLKVSFSATDYVSIWHDGTDGHINAVLANKLRLKVAGSTKAEIGSGGIAVLGTLSSSAALTVPDLNASGKVRLTNTGDAGLATDTHAFQVGLTASTNVIIDGNEVMARSNSVASQLFLNADGGASGGVSIGNAAAGTPLDVNGPITGDKVTIGDGNSTDGDILLKFNTDRAWQFMNIGEAATAKLMLRSLSSKNFVIQDSTPTDLFTFVTSAGRFESQSLMATTVGPNTNPGADKLYAGGYGIMGNRARLYVTNYNAAGVVVIGVDGIHNADPVAVFAATGLTVAGNIAGVNGDFTGTLDARGTLQVEGSGAGRIKLIDENAPTNEKQWIIRSAGGQLQLQAYTDAGAWASNAILINRTGTVIDDITLSTDLLMFDQTLDQPVIRDYAIESASLTVSANAVTLTYSNGPAFEVDLELATATVTITISGGPPSGTYGEVIVKVRQDTTASRGLLWAGGTFEWAGGTPPVMTAAADAFDIFHFSTWDGGTTWWGSAIQDMK